MFQAYLTLFSGLSISAIAEFYSIMGLIAIYPAAFWPIVIMGVALGIGKLTGTVWLKQNWNTSPFFLKAYLLPAVVLLMIITSIGVFGFLSKAHSDQILVSGDVQAKISIYDEKIKTSKENIDANRKALKQMDEAVDQVMARSTDEKGADKAVALRRNQAKERSRLLSEIEAEQKKISKLNEERAPIAAEVRKVEADVGPIKYIAAFIYGDNPDANLLERAVTWVSILIVIVLDPLAVILLLASQFSFDLERKKREKFTNNILPTTSENINSSEENPEPEPESTGYVHGPWPFPEKEEEPDYDHPEANWGGWDEQEEKKEPTAFEKYPYLNKKWVSKVPGGVSVGPVVVSQKPPEPEQPIIEYKVLDDIDEKDESSPYSLDERPGDYLPEPIEDIKNLIGETEAGVDPIEQWNNMLANAEKAVTEETEEKPKKKLVILSKEYISIDGTNYYFNSLGGHRPEIKSSIDLAKELMSSGEYELVRVPANISREEIIGQSTEEKETTYVQNEEQAQSDQWTKIAGRTITEEEYLEAARRQQEKKDS